MRKIQLDLDNLSVETFETGAAEAVRGTVRGHVSHIGTCNAVLGSCQLNGTCAVTCIRCTL